MTAFRVLVTGSRDWTHPAVIARALDTAFDTMLRTWRTTGRPIDQFVVVHGACTRGADQLADRHARHHRWTVEAHPANWARLGRRAGMVRNAEMVAAGADLCLAFIRDHSRGATDCADRSERAGVTVRRYHDCVCHPLGNA